MEMEKNQPPPPYSGNQFDNPGYGDPYNAGGPPQQPQNHPMYNNAGSSWQQPPSQPMYVPQPTIVMAPPTPQTTTNVIVTGGGAGLGGCPICHNNSWTGTYSCCAWLLAIFCFPVGIICCCCMRHKKCTKCGYTVG